MTPSVLATAMGIPIGLAAEWADPLTGAMQRFDIASPVRIAAFIAQIGHESAGLSRLEEQLNYSAARLCEIWHMRFYLPPESATLTDDSGRVLAADRANALHYAYRPIAIGNHAYANRMGNGDEGSQDGHNFRGRGPMMLTGHDAYKALGGSIGVDLVRAPGQVLDPPVGALSAAWFWHTRNCNALADSGDFEALTRAINGGLIGLDDRRERLRIATNALQPFGPGDPSANIA